MRSRRLERIYPYDLKDDWRFCTPMGKAQDTYWPGLLQRVERITEATGEATNCMQRQSGSQVLYCCCPSSLSLLRS